MAASTSVASSTRSKAAMRPSSWILNDDFPCIRRRQVAREIPTDSATAFWVTPELRTAARTASAATRSMGSINFKLTPKRSCFNPRRSLLES